MQSLSDVPSDTAQKLLGVSLDQAKASATLKVGTHNT